MSDIAEKIRLFNPDGVGSTNGNIFGLPFETDESSLVFIPVPWDVTVSNHEGTCHAPRLIFEHSSQIDLFDPFSPDAWKKGMAMETIDEQLTATNNLFRRKAATYIRFLEEGGHPGQSNEMSGLLEEINQVCVSTIDLLEKKCRKYIQNGQRIILIGGDHSVGFALVSALTEKYPEMGVLQIDAHADLRKNYQGFAYSHASVMYDILTNTGVSKLVQVGVRELCDEEIRFLNRAVSRVSTWYDRDLCAGQFSGGQWAHICDRIVDQLPEKVYVSFDIDGLDPSNCPNTGTPVPGGLTYNQAMYLLEAVSKSGRNIVGADLVETGPDTFDAMIACRILYRMAGMMLKDVEKRSMPE